MPGSGFCHQVFANHTKHIRMTPLLSVCNEHGKNNAEPALKLALLPDVQVQLLTAPSESSHRSAGEQVLACWSGLQMSGS